MQNTTMSLIRSLNSSDGTERRQAALALGAVHDASVVAALLDRIKVETSSCVREDLTWAIMAHAEAAGPTLLTMTGSSDASERRTAAHVISKVGDPAHFEHVRGLVADPDADVAIKAYRAAANTGGAAAVADLAARLGDGDLLQRDALTNALQTLGAASVPALVEALASPVVVVRAHAAEALGHLGEEAADAVEALAAAVSDDDPEVRVAAVAALGQLGGRAEEALTAIVAGDDPLAAAMARSYLAA